VRLPDVDDRGYIACTTTVFDGLESGTGRLKRVVDGCVYSGAASTFCVNR
jgi:hypothetical protein